MKISVIIPFFNSRWTINQVLESILSQTVLPHEIILIDDASTDNSNQIVRNFIKAHKHLIEFKLLENSSNRGPGLSRNKGIQNSSGNIICFCDADDFWMPEKLESQLLFIDTYPIVGTSYCIKILKNDLNKKIALGGVYNKNGLKTFNPLVLSSVMVNTNLISKNDLVFESIIHEDYVLWLRILKNYDINLLVLPEFLVQYNRSKTSFSSGFINKIKATYLVYKKLNYNSINSFLLTFLKILKSLKRYIF